MSTIRRSPNPGSPVLVLLGMDFVTVAKALPELESHLKARFPEIREVKLRIQPTPSSRPDGMVYSSFVLHEAWLALHFVGTTTGTVVITAITTEAIAFLKKRAKRIKDGITGKHVARRKKRPRKKP